ncbi:MAG: hypothetical protein GWO39_10120, partial [Gammaproteobacteria bacterium]|nr:hypothetical protein [Gammaproteobacteria bacterium]NIT64116.1 hypothetical protein [Gammaproteobacteria bacterium]NIV21027.1 hypothetical protein [Gammaproteobacteria bacterium]NIY32696.1 hypothetical protein [Gammaproteobacteria bacterium]
MYVFSAGRVDGDLVVGALFYTACLYVAAGRLSVRSRFPESAPVFGLLGFGIYLAVVYAFSFADVVRELIGIEPDDAIEWTYILVPLVAALGAWGLLLATGAWQRADLVRRWEVSLVLVALGLVLLIQI